MNTQTKVFACPIKIIDQPKLSSPRLFARWILVEDKLTCIWCNEN